jgi:urea transport system substrate-binding protein
LVKVDPENQQTGKMVSMGEVQPDGQFKELWNSKGPVRPDPYLKSYTWASELSK